MIEEKTRMLKNISRELKQWDEESRENGKRMKISECNGW
jgi:hypothetical protein